MIVGITGGTGFVGRRLVTMHVTRGDRVRVLSRNVSTALAGPQGVAFHAGDLAGEPEALQRFVDGLDVLYHCAGETQDETRMRIVNVRGAENLLAAASGRIGRWVQLSSVGAYGPLLPEVVTEDQPLRPEGEYESTKTEADHLVSERAGRGEFAHSILRPCKIIGIRMRDRSLYTMVSLVKRGLFFYIGRVGAILNYVHVDDVARALVLLGVNPACQGRVYNLAQQITVEAFAAAIAEALGVRPPRTRLPETMIRALAALTAWVPGNPLTVGRINGLTSATAYSSERICVELDFQFSRTIAFGLREIVAEWRGPNH
jgi:nucleoside-diphosphate-sugar epimerase